MKTVVDCVQQETCEMVVNQRRAAVKVARAFQRKIFFVDRTIVGRCLRPMCPPDKAAENRNKLRGMSVIVIGPGRWTTRCCHIAGSSLKCPAVLVCNANCDIGLKSGADEESG